VMKWEGQEFKEDVSSKTDMFYPQVQTRTMTAARYTTDNSDRHSSGIMLPPAHDTGEDFKYNITCPNQKTYFQNDQMSLVKQEEQSSELHVGQSVSLDSVKQDMYSSSSL